MVIQKARRGQQAILPNDGGQKGSGALNIPSRIGFDAGCTGAKPIKLVIYTSAGDWLKMSGCRSERKPRSVFWGLRIEIGMCMKWCTQP